MQHKKTHTQQPHCRKISACILSASVLLWGLLLRLLLQLLIHLLEEHALSTSVSPEVWVPELALNGLSVLNDLNIQDVGAFESLAN